MQTQTTEEIMTAKERLAVCKSCDKFNNTTKFCGVCHCFMPVKTRLGFTECPEKKWLKDFMPAKQ